jgi:tetratricopeptide (TPR) repeat protein
LITGWFWYLGTLVPVIGLVQAGSQSIADRYMYVPSIGLFIVAAWGANQLLRWLLRQESRQSRVAGAAAVVVLAACTWATGTQVAVWKDSETLFTHAGTVTINNVVAFNNLGACLSEKGRTNEAAACFQTALKIKPDYSDAHANLAHQLAREGKRDEAIAEFGAALRSQPGDADIENQLACQLALQGRMKEASARFESALRHKPDYLAALNNLGSTLNELGMPAEAETYLRQAISLKPDFADPHHNLGNALARQGKSSEAMTEYKEALRLRPQMAEANYKAGDLLGKQGKLDEAAAFYRAALRSKPSYAEAHYQLAMVLVGQKRFSEAMPHLKKAVELRPRWVEALNNLAWLMATQTTPGIQDGKTALILARRALEFSAPDDAAAYDTLAAALAANGEFGEATKSAQRALELSRAAGTNGLFSEIQARLALYQANKPYREQ